MYFIGWIRFTVRVNILQQLKTFDYHCDRVRLFSCAIHPQIQVSGRIKSQCGVADYRASVIVVEQGHCRSMDKIPSVLRIGRAKCRRLNDICVSIAIFDGISTKCHCFLIGIC